MCNPQGGRSPAGAHPHCPKARVSAAYQTQGSGHGAQVSPGPEDSLKYLVGHLAVQVAGPLPQSPAPATSSGSLTSAGSQERAVLRRPEVAAAAGPAPHLEDAAKCRGGRAGGQAGLAKRIPSLPLSLPLGICHPPPPGPASAASRGGEARKCERGRDAFYRSAPSPATRRPAAPRPSAPRSAAGGRASGAAPRRRSRAPRASSRRAPCGRQERSALSGAAAPRCGAGREGGGGLLTGRAGPAPEPTAKLPRRGKPTPPGTCRRAGGQGGGSGGLVRPPPAPARSPYRSTRRPIAYAASSSAGRARSHAEGGRARGPGRSRGRAKAASHAPAPPRSGRHGAPVARAEHQQPRRGTRPALRPPEATSVFRGGWEKRSVTLGRAGRGLSAVRAPLPDETRTAAGEGGVCARRLLLLLRPCRSPKTPRPASGCCGAKGLLRRGGFSSGDSGLFMPQQLGRRRGGGRRCGVQGWGWVSVCVSLCGSAGLRYAARRAEAHCWGGGGVVICCLVETPGHGQARRTRLAPPPPPPPVTSTGSLYPSGGFALPLTRSPGLSSEAALRSPNGAPPAPLPGQLPAPSGMIGADQCWELQAGRGPPGWGLSASWPDELRAEGGWWGTSPPRSPLPPSRGSAKSLGHCKALPFPPRSRSRLPPPPRRAAESSLGLSAPGPTTLCLCGRHRVGGPPLQDLPVPQLPRNPILMAAGLGVESSWAVQAHSWASA